MGGVGVRPVAPPLRERLRTQIEIVIVAYHSSIFGIAGALMVCIPIACSLSSAVDDGVNVEVAVDDATFDFNDSTGWVVGALALSIHNAGTKSVWFHDCGTVLERREDGDWYPVWHTICILIEGREVEIAPGERHAIEVPVSAQLGFGISGRWSQPVGGEYRLRVALRDARSALSVPMRTSDPFQLQLR